MNPRNRFDQLAARTTPTELGELEMLFDGLADVEEAFMVGDWDGGVFVTGHPGEAQLPAMQWIGKSFRSRDDVDPIVSPGADGARVANPIMGSASLRRVEYRGVVTATMVYDKHPIFDHFRRVDDDTVLGVMDRKKDPFPLFFWLRRCRPSA
ncbi:MAG: DUF4334 domain-containing protein [Sinimarinibacterium sp.]|jgi:hypothetical protein